MGVTLIVLSVLVAGIWIIIEIKRLKHKLFAIFLIGLIIFSYASFALSIKGQNLDLKTISGLTQATKLYFAWLTNAFGNFKSITTNAVNMDWNANKTNERLPRSAR